LADENTVIENEAEVTSDKKSKKKSGSSKYPSKTTINLYVNEKKKEKNVAAIVIFAVFMILLAIFTKFMVIDLIGELNDAKSEYVQLQTEVEELRAYNASIDEVTEAYYHYGVAYLSETELNIRNRAEVLAVIDEKVHIDGGISKIEMQDNSATLTIESVTLSDIANIVGALEESDIVSYVSVSTAKRKTSSDGQIVDASISVTFTNAIETATSTDADATAAAMQAILDEEGGD